MRRGRIFPGTSDLSDQTLRFKSEYNKLTRLEQGAIDGLLLASPPDSAGSPGGTIRW
jgi:hypothetical protein